MHKLRYEKTLLDPDSRLQSEIDILLELLQGEKPWNAKVSVLEDPSTILSRLLFRACASGATTLAWWIWHSGGSAVAQNEKGETALHGALDSGQLDTAVALVLHMGANLFLPDNEGRLPVDLISDDTRSQLLKVSIYLTGIYIYIIISVYPSIYLSVYLSRYLCVCVCLYM